MTIGLAFAKSPETPGCGTHAAGAQESIYLHHQAEKGRAVNLRAGARLQRMAAARSSNRDLGNIAVIDDGDGVVVRPNVFNLDLKTVAFAPQDGPAAHYKLETTGYSYDAAAAEAGSLIQGLGDDDSRAIPLRFAFPFFGATYRSLFVNSDGNLTFATGDANSTDRSLGRMVGGQPRIAPLFTDLDPTSARNGGVRVQSEAGRLVVTWDAVPLYSDFGFGQEQTFQVRLYPNGRIEFAYTGSNPQDAVTGIAPGNPQGQLTLLSLRDGSSQDFSAAVADRFAGSQAIDIAIVAQKFYASHEDSYDYLAIFNAIGVNAGSGVVAYEVTTRNHGEGYGDSAVDTGAEFGSLARLQSVLNLGPLGQYPSDPNAPVPLRFPSGDTPLTVLGHEAGHLFLAFASVLDPQNPNARPMLGRANVHWAFNFNSEASLLEGNRIQDNGAGAAARFTTIKTVEGYSPLDQYLMGLRAPAEVPPTFVVTGASVSAVRPPQTGVNFNGARRDITVDDIIAVEGRRIPDATIAQRRFRFAFILIAGQGTTPSAEQIGQVEAYRAAFEEFYGRAASGRASADTSLKSALHASVFPASGVVAGAAGKMTITLESPVARALTVFLDHQDGFADVPASVVIPVGASSVSAPLTGVKTGVMALTLRPGDASFETVLVKVPVAASAAELSLAGAGSIHRFRVWDANHVPYSGVRVTATVVGIETFAAWTATTDENGIARFDWNLLPGVNTITAVIEGAPQSALTVSITNPVVFSVANAASLAPGITPGAYTTIFGAGLSEATEVDVSGQPADLTYVSEGQINFLAPADLNGTPATVTVVEPSVSAAEFAVPVLPVSPGIFSAMSQGGLVQVYVTGLNGAAPEVSVGGKAAVVVMVAETPYPGLRRIDAQVAEGTPGGQQPVVVVAGGIRSNQVQVTLP